MKRILSIFIGIIIFTPGTLNAQTERWVYRLMDPGLNYGNSIVYGGDGNLYMAGASQQAASMDFCVLSLLSNGTERWVYRYNGPNNAFDYAYQVVYGLDGNIYAAGYVEGADGTDDFFVLSLTTAGVFRWAYRYANPVVADERARAITFGSDGNIYAGGDIYYSGAAQDFVIVSLTPAGAQNWIYRYNGPGNSGDWCTSVTYGADGNIYGLGEGVGSGTSRDITMISVTTAGAQRWVYRKNGTANDWDRAWKIVYGADNNLYGACEIYNTGTNRDFGILSVTNSGGERWLYTYNGAANNIDVANSLVYGADGNIYAVGQTYLLTGFYDLIAISVNTSGGQRWIYQVGAATYNDYGEAITYGADGKVYLVGEVYSPTNYQNLYLACLSTAGAELWTYRYNDAATTSEYGYDLVYGADGNIYTVGTGSRSSYRDIIAPSVYTMVGVNEGISQSQNRAVFSTIVRDRIMLSLNGYRGASLSIKIYDATGQLVYEKDLPKAGDFIALDDGRITELVPGIYFLNVTTGSKTAPAIKLIKI